MPETDFDAVVADVMAEGKKIVDVEGVTHTIRNPELCLVVYPGSRPRVTIENGSRIEQESHLPIDAPEDVDDVETAIAQIVAARVGEIAEQHGRQVIRVAAVGNGPAIANALREGGFCVLEFNP
jgi:hypothetical protein